jgi:hypothetical protein
MSPVTGLKALGGLLLSVALVLVLHVRASQAATPDPSSWAIVCLSAAGMTVGTTGGSTGFFDYPEIEHQIHWAIDKSNGETIFFARSATEAVRLEGRLHQVATAFGATPQELQYVVGRSGDVVWLADGLTRLTATQLALLERCVSGVAVHRPLSKTAYEAAMHVVAKSFTKAYQEIGGSATAYMAQLGLRLMQSDLRQAAKELEAITPPAQVAPAHRRLVKAVSLFADELNPIIKRLKAGKISALAEVTKVSAYKEIAADSEAITNKGYDIG